MRIAVCQLNSRNDRAANLKVARELLERAAAGGADLAVLPEYTDYLGHSADEPPGEDTAGSYAALFADAARDLRMWVHRRVVPRGRTGSGPHLQHVADLSIARGAVAAVYRKIHLFDVEIPGRVAVRESARVAAGADVVAVSIDGVRVGLLDLLRPAVSGALPAIGRRRGRPGAGRSGRVHGAHRPRPLGSAAARACHREPVLRGRRGADR